MGLHPPLVNVTTWDGDCSVLAATFRAASTLRFRANRYHAQLVVAADELFTVEDEATDLRRAVRSSLAEALAAGHRLPTRLMVVMPFDGGDRVMVHQVSLGREPLRFVHPSGPGGRMDWAVTSWSVPWSQSVSGEFWWGGS